jgi:hypothetical protein
MPPGPDSPEERVRRDRPKKQERGMLIESLNSLKETLDEAIPRAVNNKKKPM